MQKVVLNQSLMFEDGMKRRGDVITLQNSAAKMLKDQGVVEYVGDETDEVPEPETSKNSVRFTDTEGKKVYDSGTTAKHLEEDKKKPTVTEVKKEKAPKEK